MRIHLHECKATIGLETSFKDIAEVLKEGDQVILGGVGGEVAHVASSLPLGSLLSNHIIALNAVGGEVVVSERSSRRHTHSNQSLLLRD
jgi:hypothetical protein